MDSTAPDTFTNAAGLTFRRLENHEALRLLASTIKIGNVEVTTRLLDDLFPQPVSQETVARLLTAARARVQARQLRAGVINVEDLTYVDGVSAPRTYRYSFIGAGGSPCCANDNPDPSLFCDSCKAQLTARLAQQQP
jgi:hypothetical protein